MSTLVGHYQPLIERYLDHHYSTQAFAIDWLVFKGEVRFWSQVISEEFDLFFPDAANIAWGFVCLAAQQNATEIIKPTARASGSSDVNDELRVVGSKSPSPFYRYSNNPEQCSVPTSTKHRVLSARNCSTTAETILGSPTRLAMELLDMLPTEELPMTMMPSPLRQAWVDLFSAINDSEVPLFTFHFIVGVDIHNGVSKTKAHQEAIGWLESDCLNGLFGGRWYLSPDLSVRQLSESELSGLSSGHFPEQSSPSA